MAVKHVHSELDAYKDLVQAKLADLVPVFARAMIGDFSKDVPYAGSEDEFSELYVGVQIMLDVIRDKLGKLGKWNDELAEIVKEKTKAFEEAQYLAHIGSWECEVAPGLLSLSNEMCRIYGLPQSLESIRYADFLVYIHPDDREYVESTVSDAYKTGEPFIIQYRILRADGEMRILEGRGKVLLDKHDQPVRMLGTAQDVTELKRAEAELLRAKNELELKVEERTKKLKSTLEDLRREMGRKEEAKAKVTELAAIVQGTTDAVLGKTLDGYITSWNKGAQKLYGYSAREAVGQHISLIVPKNKRKELDGIMERLSDGKGIQRLETVRRNKAGNNVHVSLTISPIQNASGEIIGASSIAKDITKQVAAQEKMRQSRKMLNNFMNAAKDTFVIFDANMKVLDINKAGTKLMGRRTKKDLVGRHLTELFPLSAKSQKRMYQKTLETGRSKSFEDFVAHPAFGERYFSMEVFRLESGIGLIARDITEHKLNEQALNESEKKYRTLVETMNEGVLVVNNRDEVEFVNSTFCQQTGYSQEELMGRKATEVLLDKDQQERMARIVESRMRGESSQYELELTTKSGQKLWMLVNGSPVYDNSNRVVGSVGLHTNITQRKQHEAELDALAKFPAESPSPVMRFSMHGQALIYVNRAAVHLVQALDSDEELHHHWMELVTRVYRENKVMKEEIDIAGRTYLFTIVPIHQGHYINLYGTDVTAAKKAEEEVKRLLFVLSQTDNSILIANHQGEIQWVNAAFQRISGYSLDDVKGTHGEVLRHGKYTGLDPQHPYFKRMQETRHSVSYESKNYAKSGREFWSLTTLTPVLNENGEIEGIVAMDSDVTEKKKAEKDIIKSRKIAESSVKARELFMANMSHEIRTPMNAIMGIIQLLRETHTTEQQEKYLKSMEFASENLLRIIDDVLDLSKIESGKLSIEKLEFNIGEMVKDLINTISYRANEQNIDLKLVMGLDIPDVILGDPVRINQILMNLISNSIKFTHEGSVKLSVDLKEAGKDRCVLRFTVKDTGIGIPKDKQEQIFEEFEQAHKGNTRKYGGTGLGLSIVKRLTKLMDGTLKMRSKEGKGTTFIIDLPLEIAHSRTPNSKVVEGVEDLREKLVNKSVLLVEDNKLNQMVASDFLGSMGMNVQIANDGMEALDKIRNGVFDVVLMDIQMPGMDGYKTTRAIRHELKSKVPIIAMTAHAINGEERKCKAVGMNDYISKPLKKITLYKKIANLVI
ncbi:MAG: PAS domain S-box protein [Flavobacteriales bacterium]|nr:PAS domain S-box protein [Flavobacteriales bacterium]MCB9447783.1 PAS domain S-box protein [Flavobacteriales bacterium]